MTQRLRLSAALGTLLYAASARAQTAGGQIFDSRGVPIRGAAVQLLDTARAVLDSTVSDTTGGFYLRAPKQGRYVLRFSAPGFATVDGQPFQLSADDFHQERIQLHVAPSERVYFEFEVQEHVRPLPGNPSPQYPLSLRQSHTEGQVLLQFVVDTTGRAVMGSAKALRSTHEDFTRAVMVVLPSLRFEPARVKDHPVSQLVQMPFYFNITP